MSDDRDLAVAAVYAIKLHVLPTVETAAVTVRWAVELAGRSGLQERYVREWLGAMVCAGIMTFDPADGRYTLPVEHAVLLTGSGARNLAPMTALITTCGSVMPDLEQAFRDGGGIPYERYQPAFVDTMDDLWRRIYDEQLVEGFLAPVPGVTGRLAEGIDVLDIGCGTGHAANVLARAFPRSTMTGHDFTTAAIACAERERTELGLSNAAFAVGDIAELTPQPAFDLITALDVIYDQRAPDEVLRRVHAALRPDGVFVMVEPRFSTQLQNNVGNPFAALYYGISLTHYMPVSLAQGGAGLGAVWGRELAEDMVTAAGFATVEVLDSPRPQTSIFVCRPRRHASPPITGPAVNAYWHGSHGYGRVVLAVSLSAAGADRASGGGSSRAQAAHALLEDSRADSRAPEARGRPTPTAHHRCDAAKPRRTIVLPRRHSPVISVTYQNAR